MRGRCTSMRSARVTRSMRRIGNDLGLANLLREHHDYFGARVNYKRVISSHHAEYAPDAAVNLGKLYEPITPTRSPPAATSPPGPGRRGDARDAFALFEALLPDLERVLGRDHPDTLTTRHNIAGWTGKTGHARGALALFKALLRQATHDSSSKSPPPVASRVGCCPGDGGIKNRDWLNRLLLLFQLEVNNHADERAYAKRIRDRLEATGGRPSIPRRAIADPAARPSLRDPGARLTPARTRRHTRTSDQVPALTWDDLNP